MREPLARILGTRWEDAQGRQTLRAERKLLCGTNNLRKAACHGATP
jgi:hypothetical protein